MIPTTTAPLSIPDPVAEISCTILWMVPEIDQWHFRVLQLLREIV
jgi:hypothetical protein